MQVKILFAGEGVTYSGFGLSFAGFKIWTGGPQEFRGFTGATNEALFGASIIETPVVDLGNIGEDREKHFRNLHGKVGFVKIEPTTFFHDGGIATVKLTVKEQVGGTLVEDSIEFIAENCRGVSATAGAIEFTMELFQLPQNEWDPFGSVIP
ncbi:hypothetical protein [Priestia megaterium]|uniref:hypothetical protein n=1 Tax=Priestia megaterium TaxID=1404 RepID=UPI003101832B